MVSTKYQHQWKGPRALHQTQARTQLWRVLLRHRAPPGYKAGEAEHLPSISTVVCSRPLGWCTAPLAPRDGSFDKLVSSSWTHSRP